MRWTERQQALLQGMGLRLWAPPALAEAPAPAQPLPALPLQLPVAEAVADTAPAQAGVPRSATPARPNAVASVAVARPPGAPAAAPAGRGPARPRPPSPVDSLDWPALAEAVAGCQACGLCQTRRNTVFGVGHTRARVMVVGEAPGEHEDRQGEPFVGAAGQLLDRMLAALGLSRTDGPPGQQVYIANTLKCRPPGNRNPTPAELAQCVPYLERQVALVQPQVILAMGRFAVQALLASDEPLGRLRGRVHHWQGRPLVVTYHPAYLLRQPADKARAWADLCLAAQQLTEPAGGA